MIDPPKNDEIYGLTQEKDAHSNWAVEKYRNQSISSSTNGTDSTDWRVPGFLGSLSKHMLKSSALSGRGHHFRPQVAVSSLSSSEKKAPQVNLGPIPLSWEIPKMEVSGWENHRTILILCGDYFVSKCGISDAKSCGLKHKNIGT